LYLSHLLEGSPAVEDFAEDWQTKVKEIWDGLRQRYSWHVFTEDRVAAWDKFMGTLPWDGSASIPDSMVPLFGLAPFQPLTSSSNAESDAVEVQHMIAGVGEDEKGHPRMYFHQGQDCLHYPRAVSTVAYNDLRLDGTKRQPKKRKRESE
jgi:hypothetical protein